VFAAISIWTRTGDLDHILIVGSYFHYTGSLVTSSSSNLSSLSQLRRAFLYIRAQHGLHFSLGLGLAFRFLRQISKTARAGCVQMVTLLPRPGISRRRPNSLGARAIQCT
jgi:hypothetical protein